jgi:hypothetical protein
MLQMTLRHAEFIQKRLRSLNIQIVYWLASCVQHRWISY